jgi:hypothetical protein
MRNRVPTNHASIYDGPDVAILGRLSKAALLDLAVSRLRLSSGNEAADETPLTEDQLFEAIEGDLLARGERFPKARK